MSMEVENGRNLYFVLQYFSIVLPFNTLKICDVLGRELKSSFHLE